MTGERYPDGRFGTPELPEASDEDSRAASLARAVQRLPKPEPSQAVGSTLNVTPFPDPVQELIDAAEIQARDLEEDHLDDERWGDTTTSVAEADDEQRAYLQRRIDKQHGELVVLRRSYQEWRDSPSNKGLRQHNLELIGSVLRLEERLSDATVRAYEPPDTLTGVAFAAAEGLLATGKRWWRR